MRLFVRTTALLASLATLTAASAASAEGLPLDRFEPAPAGDRMFDVPSPHVGGHLAVSGALLFDYAHAPLVFRAEGSSSQVVSSQLFLHANATLSLWNRLAVNLDLPIAASQAGNSPVVGGVTYASPDGAQIGDLRAGLRLRILGEEESAFQLSLGGYTWFPTAGADGYAGSGKVRGMPQLLLGGLRDRFVWSFMAGPRFQGSQVYAGVTHGTELSVGAGFAFLLLRDRSLQLGAESYAAFTLARADGAVNDSARTASNVEVLFDVRYRVAGLVDLGVGMGPGLTVGLGTPDFRGVFMAAYRFEPTRAAPQARIAGAARSDL